MKLWQRIPLPIAKVIPLGAILLLGFWLRVYRLGAASLWYDEACQAQAALAPTLQGMFEILRHQVGAMPLDFLVTRLFASFGNSEVILRIPSLIWGTLTLGVGFHLFQRLTERKVALLATLLLALTPIHIGFSQEARYYASLVFFYLLSTDLLLSAIQHPSVRRWTVFTVVAVVGIYFQPFNLFCFVNGLFWLLARRNFFLRLRTSWLPFLLSGCVAVILAFLYIFSGNTTSPFHLGTDNIGLAVSYALVVGLGWIPPNYVFPGIGWIWGIFIFGFGTIGILRAFRRQSPDLAALAVSVLVQIILIILADLTVYFPFPRQFLMLLPLMLLFSSLGASVPFVANSEKVPSQLAKPVKYTGIVKAGGLILMGIWLLSSLPALADFYHADKSRAGEISQALVDRWKNGDQILVIGTAQIRLEKITYQYYFQQRMHLTAITAALQDTDWETLPKDMNCPCKTYLITTAGGPSPYLPDQDIQILNRLGYRPVPISPDDDRYSQRLWVRE